MKPLEFEKISVAEAKRAVDGEPAKQDANKCTHKRTQPPQEPLLDVTRTWLASLPQEVRPMELARQFPRIANRLRHLWKQVARCEEYLDALLVDRRGNRKGFPQKITLELEALREYHEVLYPRRRSMWDDVEERR
jgi:hypothetical protein